MLLLGIDLETGGDFNSPPENNFITELGFVVWDTELGQPVRLENFLIDEDKEIHPKAVQYTGITTKMVRTYCTQIGIVWTVLSVWASKADYIVAHNGCKFDKQVIEAFAKRHKLPPLPDKVWLDTMTDINYPENCMSRNLTYLSAFHKILNYFQHRAVTDVLTMFEVMFMYPLEDIINNAKDPILTVRALTSFQEKDKAKEAGFYWKPDELPDANGKKSGMWLKEVPFRKFNDLYNSTEFSMKIINITCRDKNINFSIDPLDYPQRLTWDKELNNVFRTKFI